MLLFVYIIILAIRVYVGLVCNRKYSSTKPIRVLDLFRSDPCIIIMDCIQD